MTIKKAMILAAGLGTRMRPITDTLPKPLVKAGGITLLDRILDNLAQASIHEVVVNSYYLAEILEAHITERLKYKAAPHIIVSRETEVLETGGGVAQALPLLGDAPFFVINGDVLWRDDSVPTLSAMSRQWNDALDALLLLHPTETAIGYEGKGDFNLETDDSLSRPEIFHALPYVFAGISIMHPRIFYDLPAPPFSLSQLYWRSKDSQGVLKGFKGMEHKGEWLHIGTPEGLEEANHYLLKHIST